MLHCSPESSPPYTFVQLYLPFYEINREPTDLQKDFRTILSQGEFWTTDSYPLMASWVADNSPFLDHLRTIVRCDYFAIPIIDTGFQEEWSLQFYAGIEYRMITSLGSSLKCRALFFAGNGDWHEAIEDIIAGIYLEWHLLQMELSRAYFVERPPDFLAFARKVIQTEEFLADDSSQEFLATLLEAINACSPKMPEARFYFMEKLFALEALLGLQRLTRDSILESPGIFLAPEKQVSSVLFDDADETTLSRYTHMTFDWNIALTAILKEIDEIEQWSKEFSIKNEPENSARQLVALQRSKYQQQAQKWRDFEKTARDNPLHLSFMATRSELLGKLRFGERYSYSYGELTFIDKHETWLRLKSEIESLSNQIP